jgi:succinate dehydrogenase assembly factor 2
LAKERYDTRANEDIEKKRARLLYQSRKRGMLENGVILASFANKYLNTLDADHLDQYDRLINLPTNDWDIYYWATNTKPTPPEFETPVLGMLREHLKSKVSNEGQIELSDGVLGKTRLDDIVLPAKGKHYELDIDVSKVDLTNYKANNVLVPQLWSIR